MAAIINNLRLHKIIGSRYAKETGCKSRENYPLEVNVSISNEPLCPKPNQNEVFVGSNQSEVNFVIPAHVSC